MSTSSPILLPTVIKIASPLPSMCMRKCSPGSSAFGTGMSAACTTMSSAKKSGITAMRQGASTRSFLVSYSGSVFTNTCPIFNSRRRPSRPSVRDVNSASTEAANGLFWSTLNDDSRACPFAAGDSTARRFVAE